MQSNDIVLSRVIDNLLLDLRGLVLVRGLLAERGATQATLHRPLQARPGWVKPPER